MIKRTATGAWFVLLALPWITPLGPPPTPMLQPWMASIGCGVLLWLWRAKLDATQMQRGWLLAAAVSALIGLVQYAGVRHGLEPWVALASPGDAFGNLRQRNQFATLMNIGLAALLWMSLQRSPTRPVLALVMVATVLVMTGSAASASRTGFLELLLLLSIAWIWGLWQRPNGRRIMLMAVLSYVVASVVLPGLLREASVNPGVWARFQDGTSGCGGRATLWDNVLQLIVTKPWTGWGWGELDYAHFITLYEGPRFCEMLDNAHNLPLHIAVEFGVPAALLLCVPGLFFVWRARPWREARLERQFAWAVLGIIFLHSLLEYPLWFGPFQLAFWSCVWLLWTTGRHGSKTPRPQGTNWRDMALAAGTLAAVTYVAWDYHRIGQIYLAPERRVERYRQHTLDKIRDSWLFRDQVRFAEFTITPLTRDNAAQLYAMGLQLLHYSPEPRVVEKLIECATLLERNEEARFYLERFRAAYPNEYARWAAGMGAAVPPPN